MHRARFLNPMRFLLAFVTLAASLCSVPTFGHSHGGIDHDTHHLALVTEDHELEHEHLGARHEPEITLSDSVYHLHGVLFGLQVSLAADASGLTLGAPFPFSEPCLTAASARDLLSSHRPEVRVAWPDWGPSHFDLPTDARLLAFSDRTSLDSVRSAAALAPRSRTVVLRC